MRLLVTGGAGFIGSNFVHHWLKEHPGDDVVVYDTLTYAGNRANLADVEDAIEFVHADICDPEAAQGALGRYGIEVVVHFAAESHNSRAALDPGLFVRTNVLGTQTLLEAARRAGVERFHHISTCEVFGEMALDEKDAFREDSPYRPRTPYSASKAAADHIVRSYIETFGLPVTITNCANNYGPYQFPEKLVALCATRALDDRPLPLYASLDHRREWIHVDDHCRAVEAVLERGRVGETYLVGTGVEATIEEIADLVLGAARKPPSLKSIVPDRPGHDSRYLLDSGKLRTELGWAPEMSLQAGIAGTVAWYEGNRSWWEPLLERAPVDEHGWADAGARHPGEPPVAPRASGPWGMRFLVTGAGGQLGRELVDVLERDPDAEVVGADHGALPVDDGPRVDEALDRLRPDAVLHVAALTDVDRCEREPEIARAVNETGTANVARAAAAIGAHLLYVSTDYVFDGEARRPYRESDPTHPLSVYGATKLGGELACPASATVVRTAWVAGNFGPNFVRAMFERGAGQGELRVVDDQRSSPTFTADLAPALVALAKDRRSGRFHVTNAGEASRYELARETFARMGSDPTRVTPISTAELVPARDACRPAYSALDNGAFHAAGYRPLPPWEDGLDRLLSEFAAAGW